jgi:hypothetical protein
LTVIVLLDSLVILETLDPTVSETGPSGFAELGSVEQIVALYIGQKSNCSVWQIRTSSFSRKPNFLDLIKNLMLPTPNHSPLHFHP